MTMSRPAASRVVQEILNEGVPPKGNQSPPNEKVPLDGNVLVNPLIMTNDYSS